MKAFIHKGRTYIRVIPSKFMMNSTMIYEITTRGDILALDVETQVMIVIKGTEQVEHLIASVKTRLVLPENPSREEIISQVVHEAKQLQPKLFP